MRKTEDIAEWKPRHSTDGDDPLIAEQVRAEKNLSVSRKASRNYTWAKWIAAIAIIAAIIAYHSQIYALIIQWFSG